MTKELCLTAIAFIVMCQAAYSAEIGRMVAIKGKVLIKRDGVFKDARLDDAVFLDDTIDTRSGSKAKILFKDNSVITLSENTTLKLKEYLLHKEPKKSRSVLNLTEGNIRALVGKNIFDKFEVQTPTAVVGVKGTYFSVWLETIDGLLTTGIGVHEGEVQVMNINPKVKGTVSLKQGEKTVVAKDSPPLTAQPLSEEKEKELLDCEE